MLSNHFSPKSSITATVQQLPAGIKIKKMFDFKNNLKITYPEDLFIAEQLIKLKYYRKKQLNHVNYDKIGKILILGGSGGVGRELIRELDIRNINYRAPSHHELDLEKLSLDSIMDYLGDFNPDSIINLAASSISDSDGILENFDKVFKVNLQANLVIIEFAKRLNKRINLVFLSSSSSTKGRENITLYSASKAALNSVVESLSEFMSRQNILINCIIPEKINTPLIKKLHKKDISDTELLDIAEIIDAILNYTYCDHYGELIHIRKGL